MWESLDDVFIGNIFISPTVHKIECNLNGVGREVSDVAPKSEVMVFDRAGLLFLATKLLIHLIGLCGWLDAFYTCHTCIFASEFELDSLTYSPSISFLSVTVYLHLNFLYAYMLSSNEFYVIGAII